MNRKQKKMIEDGKSGKVSSMGHEWPWGMRNMVQEDHSGWDGQKMESNYEGVGSKIMNVWTSVTIVQDLSQEQWKNIFLKFSCYFPLWLDKGTDMSALTHKKYLNNYLPWSLNTYGSWELERWLIWFEMCYMSKIHI